MKTQLESGRWVLAPLGVRARTCLRGSLRVQKVLRRGTAILLAQTHFFSLKCLCCNAALVFAVSRDKERREGVEGIVLETEKMTIKTS